MSDIAEVDVQEDPETGQWRACLSVLSTVVQNAEGWAQDSGKAIDEMRSLAAAINERAAEWRAATCPAERTELLADALRDYEPLRIALRVLHPPLTVCSDLPMFAMRSGQRRVVCSANQNNVRHYGESVPWAGIPDSDTAFAIASVVNAAPSLLARIDALEAELLRLCGPSCPYDGKRAVEHRASPTTGALGLDTGKCTWRAGSYAPCCRAPYSHDAKVDAGSEPAHGYESVGAHERWTEGDEWLAKRNAQ